MPLSQVDIEKIKHLRDVSSATTYLFSQITRTPRLQKALDFSIESHKEQFRKSGEPYIIHPILVSAITASITNDESMAVAALLHDVVEILRQLLKRLNTCLAKMWHIWSQG